MRLPPPPAVYSGSIVVPCRSGSACLETGSEKRPLEVVVIDHIDKPSAY
jgi:hypothetical protein